MTKKKSVILAIVICCVGISGWLYHAHKKKREQESSPVPTFTIRVPLNSPGPDMETALSADAGRIQDNCGEETPSKGLTQRKPGEEKCVWAFCRYEPSPWEEEWRREEESGERKNQECEILGQQQEAMRSRQLVSAIRDLVLNGKAIPPESIGLFSRMVYAKRCGPELRDTGERRVQLIEPLVGLLRDPLTMCPPPRQAQGQSDLPFDFGEDAVQSKRHLLIGPAAPWTDTPADASSWRTGGFEPWAVDASKCRDPRIRQNMLVDIGASLYGIWKKDRNAVGAQWFVDRYQRHHMDFDKIVSYEIEKHDPDDIYKNIPPDLLPRYFYFNQGVEATPNGKWNPWRILQGMGVTANDYVAIKLDIDFPDIEGPLMQQLIDDPQVRLLVDEFYFEHHVNVKAMWNSWGSQKFPQGLKDSYQIFGYLRSKGVRMHGWP